MYANIDIGITEALIVTVFSMAIVFASLLIISFALSFFEKIFGGQKAPVSASAAPVAAAKPAAPAEDENIEAAIMAAIFEYERKKRSNPIARNMK